VNDNVYKLAWPGTTLVSGSTRSSATSSWIMPTQAACWTGLNSARPPPSTVRIAQVFSSWKTGPDLRRDKLLY
jgi:hypothetical protein